MELNKNDKNYNLVANYVQAFNLSPQLKDLFSQDDKLFADCLKYYTFLNLRTSKTGQLYPQQIAFKIQALLKNKLLSRVSKIIKESKDVDILNTTLTFVTNRDKKNKINILITDIEFSQQIAERVLLQENYQLFQLFLNYIEFKHVKEETKQQIKNILNLGQDVVTNQQNRKKLQQKFKELETDQDFKHVSVCSIINSQRLKIKSTIKADQLEQILQIFKIEKTNKSQRVLQMLLTLDLPPIIQFVQTAAYTKFTVDPVVKYQQNEIIHSSFFTKQNILLFCSYLNNRRKISSLYLFASKQSIIENQKGIYLLLPIEAYPKTMDQEILNLTNQLPDLLQFTRTILTAIKENKPIYSPFEKLTFQKQITLLIFCCNIFRYIPEYDDQDGADINLVTQSNLISDTLVFLTQILDKKDTQSINEIVLLFSTLVKGFIIYPLDPTNLNRLSNSGIIESIYKILTSYSSSIYFFNDLLFLYEHQFRNILRACNKIDLFETSLLIDKIVQAILSLSQINTSQIANLVSLLIESRPAFEEQVKTQIIKIANEYLSKSKQYFQDLKHSVELKIISVKLNLLFRMKTIKTTTQMKLMNIKLRKLNYESSNYNRHNSMDFDILDYKDIDMKQSEMIVSLDQVITSLKSQQFKNTFTFNQLKEQVSLLIHKKFLDDIYNILAFMNYHSKDIHKAFTTLYEKIVEVYVLLTGINFENYKTIKKGINQLKQQQVLILKQNTQALSYAETQSLFDYFTGVGQIYAQNLDFLLRVNTKSIVPYAAKVPLSGFMKCLGKFLEIIKKSEDKQQIIFYINSLEKIWQFSQGALMSVQSYYYLYTTYQTEIYQIANKLFNEIKGQVPHFKSLFQKSKTFKEFILQYGDKENNLQKKLFYSAQSFLRIFILRKLTVFSWVAENHPNEIIYGNTKNLALGIYLDQFTRLVANLNENNILFYKTILRKFLNRNIEKTRLFEQENVSHRRGNNLRARRQVVEVLSTMGYGPQVVEMVLNELQDMSIDGAIDWINNHHQQIQSLEQTNLIRQTLLNSMQKQKSEESKSKDSSGIKQLDVNQYNTQFKQPLKNLFKKHFLAGIYGKNKDKLPELIILLIERYDKQQTRNSNYSNFISYLIKELNNEVKNKEQSTFNLNIQRLTVQFNHLTLILEKCISKKDIRESILKSSLITDLVAIIHHLGHKQYVKQEQEKIFQTALKIIKLLVPKKTDVDISIELDSILDQLLLVKQRSSQFNIHEHFWSLATQRLNYPISQVKLHKILNILFNDIEEGKADCNYGQIIEIILQSDKTFLQANIQSEIKTYFFSEGQNKIVSKLKRQFVIHFNRYNNNPIFYKIVGQILKKKNQKLYNNRKATYLIYQKDKHSYSQSIILKKTFIEYSPTKIQINILERLFSVFSKQSEPTKLKFSLLHRIIERFSLLRHYCLFQSYNNTTFIDQLLYNTPHYKSKIENVFTFFGTSFGVIFKQKEKQFYYSTYLQHYIATKIREILENQKDGNESRYVSLCYLLQFKLFNNISNEQISQTISSLRKLLEKQFTADNQFISEPLTLLYKQMTIKAISSLYVVADQDSLSEFQSQLILLPLMCISEESETKSPLDRLEQLQLGLDALADPNTFLARLQGGSSRFAEILRRQLVNDIPFEFLPIQPKGQRKQSKISNQGEVEKVIDKEQQVSEKTETKLISRMFDPILIQKIQNHKQDLIKQEQPKKPNYSLFNQQLPYIAPCQYKIAYITKMNQTLYKRINLLWKQLHPEEQIIQKKQSKKEIKKAPSFIQRHSIQQTLEEDQEQDVQIQYTRRIGEGLNPFGDNGIPAQRFTRNMRIVRNVGDSRGIAFEVDFGARRRDIQLQQQLEQQRQQQQQQQQQLNEAEIQKVLQQYVQEKKIEEPKIEQKKVQKIEENKSQEKTQEKIEKIVEQKKQEIKQQLNQGQQQLKKDKIEQKDDEKQTKTQVEKQKNQEKVEEKIEQKVEEQQKVEDEKKQQTNVEISPSPVSIPPAQTNSNPPVFRQILQTVGVPQNFLRIHGVIQEEFDSMPQQVKVDLLFQLISSQQQPEEAKHDDPIPIDILQNIPAQMRQELGVGNFGQVMTQTQILLASIDDQQMRQQIFLQASPQIISALPMVLQQQAEGIRQRRMRQIAAQQQQEYMIGNHHKRRIRRNRQNLIYPQVSKELFQKLDDKTLFQIVRTLFFKVGNNSLQLLQAIIQNKQNQQQIINTLIYILRSPLNVSEFPSQIKQKTNNQWKIVADGSQLLTNLILTTLQRIIKSSPYKDTKFLKQKISYNGLKQIKLKPKQDLFTENYVNEQFHYPFIEILTYSLKSNLTLSAYLLEGFDIVNIPKIILELIIETFKLNSLPDEYINSLKGLGDNAILKQLFINTFTEKNHPKISILAQILKYHFSRVDYLKALHLKILNTYKPQYNKFLNEIYRIYTIEELKNMKGLENFKSIHKQVIKDVLKNANIFTQPISIILKLPFLIDFETKRQIFYQKVQDWNEEGGHVGRLELRIDRNNLFSGSFSQIAPRTKEQMRGRINVTFEDEGAYDAGGPTKQWFLVVSRQMFNQNYALFQHSSSGNTYHPSSKSYINPDHLRYFKFIGRIVGKALMQKCYIDAYFTRSFYKMILGQDLNLQDMESSDFNFYKSMLWVKDNKIEDDFYRFAYDIQNFGKLETIELVPNGKDIEVTQTNKHDFVQKICLVKMKTQTHQQIKAFLQGFHQLIPLESIQYFTAEELQLLISGLPTVDIEDLRRHTEYNGYTENSKQIVWFWEILQTLDQQYLTKMIQFITGTSKIPPEGFKGLRGMHGNQKISIHKDFAIDQLPKSHTCFNQLDLPQYPTKEIMQTKLKIALNWGSQSFGFM